ncbi:MAG: methyltransferase domain-containing protein [bacterium]|nr:methyltransferase domain-containing protein [bacterium]
MLRKVRKQIKEKIKAGLCRLLFYCHALKSRISKEKLKKLHVGCGKNHFRGWINADMFLGSEMIVFLQKKLPLQNDCLERIYSEHVIEHVPFETGVFFLKEAYRVLEPGGVIRMATPDLDNIISYYTEDWKRADWVNWPEYSFIKTKAEMLNIAFRWWGHAHLYNEEELLRAFKEAGFQNLQKVAWGESNFNDLSSLETRKDSTLIIEAVK